MESQRTFELRMMQEYPLLYEDMYGDPRQTIMAFGIDVGPGWFGIIEDLSSKLEPVLRKIRAERGDYPKALQVKEKFGGLRFYMTWETKEIDDLIDEAEEKSYKTCEDCGAPGETRPGGWIRTLCDDCVKG